MMLQVIVYAMGTAAVLAAAGFCCERAALLRGRPLRFIWVLVLAGSIGGPLAAILVATKAAETPVVTLRMPDPVNSTPETQPPGVQVASAQATNAGVAAASRMPRSELVDEIDSSPVERTEVIGHAESAWIAKLPSDRTLLITWATVSGASWAYLLLANLLLGRRAASWRRATVQGQELLVSESTGPALLGTFRPRIVVPRWFLDEPPAAQALILAHEQQHLIARDPLLLRIALVAVAAVPWNLPLWWQLRRLRLAIELDCDARVMRSGVEADDYGGVLLEVSRRALNPPPGAVVAMARPVSTLEVRIDRLVRAPAQRAAAQTAGALLLAAVLVGAALALEAPPLPERSPAAQVAEQRPYTMPTLPRDPRGSLPFIQTVLERYPEIAEGRDEPGTYVVVVVLNADGSIHSSQMRFTASDQAMWARDEMMEQVPPDSTDTGSTAVRAGLPLPSGGRLRNELRVTRHMLPADYDASRSLRQVFEAVERKHADLLRPRTDGVLYKVTVMMTDDGQIHRDHVEEVRREELRLKLPEVAEAHHFEILDVEAATLGQMGVTILSRPIPGAPPMSRQGRDGQVQLLPPEQEMLFVVYAWPRSGGDATAVRNSPPLAPPTATVTDGDEAASAPFLPSVRVVRPEFSRSEVAAESRRLSDRVLEALLERYPEIVNGPNKDGWYTVAVTLRPDDSIYRSGLRFATSSEQSSQHGQELSSVLVPMGQSSIELRIKGERLASGVVLPNALNYRFNVLPPGFDEARPEHLVREAVMARHADLLLPASAGLANRVTVFMTDDGRIDREHVEFGRTADMASSTGRPEDFDFSALDLRADEIGVFGMIQHAQIDRPVNLTNRAAAAEGMRRIMIRYAWPRREGEPMGGFSRATDDVSPEQMLRRQAAEQQVRAAELIARHFPALMADPASHASARPWLLLSSQGQVLRTGQSTLGPDEPFIATTQLGPQMPGAQFAEVEFFSARGAGNRPVNAAFVWLAANSPVP